MDSHNIIVARNFLQVKSVIFGLAFILLTNKIIYLQALGTLYLFLSLPYLATVGSHFSKLRYNEVCLYSASVILPRPI